MLFARQHDLPFRTPSMSLIDADRVRPVGGMRVGRGRSTVASIRNGATSLSSGPEIRSNSRGRARQPAGVVVLHSSPLTELVAGAPPAGQSFARKRIEHAVELFGACMLIAFALTAALFG